MVQGQSSRDLASAAGSDANRIAMQRQQRDAYYQEYLPRFLDLVLTREDCVLSTSDPEPYLFARKTFGAGTDECLVVEDSQRGLQSAIAAGIDCAVVYNEFTASHDFTGARHRLNTIDELSGIIDEHGY